jgi:predicted nucleic acid-binding protein
LNWPKRHVPTEDELNGAVNIIADTSVLINFLRIDRMDLIGLHPEPFSATEHVADEISDAYPDQQTRYAAALAAGDLSQVTVNDPEELDLFLRLGQSQRLGAGERSAIAVALNRGWTLAIDDNRAFNQAFREAGLPGRSLTRIRTQDVVVTLIRNNTLTVAEADVIKDTWAARYRFRLKIVTFGDLL